MTNNISKEFHFVSLLRFAFPTMIMMMFMSLYTIVDGIFISRLLGSNALSSLNIVFPFINVIMAIGIMLATGGSAVVARRMGEGRMQEARENFSFLILVGAVCGLVLMGIGTLFMEPICRLLGSTDVLLADCIAYLQTTLFFAVICILQLFFQSFFVADGNPGLGLSLTIIGGVSNMVLDYLFMGPMQMGIAGAALATGVGQAVPAVVGCIYFARSRKSLYFVKPVCNWRMLWQSCGNGSSEMVSNLAGAVVTYLYNIIMLRLLGEDGVAAITIVLYSQFLFSALYLGFSMGVAPVISYNYGSDNQMQLKRIFRICIRFIGASSVLILLLALLFAAPIVEIFTPQETAVYGIAVHGFLLFSWNYLFAGINLFASSMFTAFSDGMVSAIISFSRTFGFIAVSILVLPQFLGTDGVWLAVPVAEVLTFAVSLAFFRCKRGAYHYI